MVSFTPRHGLAVPFLVVLYPLCWVIYRGGPGLEWLLAGGALRLTLPFLGAVLVSYAVAVAVEPRLPAPASLPGPLRPLVAPSDATVAVVGGASAALGVFVFASISFPSPLDTVARGVGVVVGWPALLSVLGSIIAAGLLSPGGLRYGVELAIVAGGVSLSALWLVILAGLLVRLVGVEATA